MKPFACVLLFAVLAVCQSPNDKRAVKQDATRGAHPSDNSKSNQQQAPVQIFVGDENPATEHRAEKEHSGEDIDVERQLAKFTKYLVWVGLLQALILATQGFLFFRQTNIMGEHKTSLEQLATAAEQNARAIETQAVTMNGQLKAMEGQLAAMQAQNVTLRESLAVAQSSVEAGLEKERARVKISVDDIIVQTTLGTTSCYLSNYGPTPAFIDDFRAKFLYCLPKEIVPDHSLCRQLMYAESIQPHSRTPATVLIPLDLGELKNSLSEDDVMKVKKEEAFIHFYGFVKYRDVFRRNREATIHLLWKMRWGGTRAGMIMQWWEPVGPREENTDE